MNEQTTTFSRRVKDELSAVPCEHACCRQTELATAFWAAGKIQQDRVVLSTGHAGCARRLADLLQTHCGVKPDWQSGRELVTVSCSRDILACFYPSGGRRTLHQMPDPFNRASLLEQPICCRQAFVRSLFLLCGSISEPSSAYHMELSVRNADVSAAIRRMLEELSIHTSANRRGSYTVLYIQEGQYLADYLLLAGAHQSLLAFESLRVEKEMRNSVNRVVNCDSANTQRIANTAARQLELIHTLYDNQQEGLLPPDLKAAAEARLEHPDLSLKELGSVMEPPLGKSGMNHRLMRLEKAAMDLLLRKES